MRNRLMTAVVGAGAATAIGVLGAGAAHAAPPYQAGPFGSVSTCNTERRAYVKDGGFSYVGACYKQTNGKYYFQYR